MMILTYSETTGGDIQGRLGRAEYSYYFIYAKYKPVLEKLGTLVAIEDPAAEVDTIYAEQPAGTCVFLSFTPPHRTQQQLLCPTVCVFAWEFSSMPAQPWGGSDAIDWAGALNTIGNGLGISNYSVDVASKVVAQGVNLAAVPAPVNAPQNWQRQMKTFEQSIRLDAVFYDSVDLLATNETEGGSLSSAEALPFWNDVPLTIRFDETNTQASNMLAGFYAVEAWGVWSRTRSPKVSLPFRIKGPVSLELELIGHGANIDRELQLVVGTQSSPLMLSEQPRHYNVELNLDSEAAVLLFADIALSQAAGRDSRTLGIGLKSLSIKRPAGYRPALVTRIRRGFSQLFGAARVEEEVSQGELLSLQGVVYTSVLNPEDGRKNWEDMVTAFCLAFANVEDATLLLKMSNQNVSTFLGTLKLLFSTLPAFKCRVVAIHGYLSEEDLQALADCSHFVVNSSLCEGQCLPLMEYMAQGVPAIAPDHTAMADYINEDNAFIVASSLQPAYWPFDENRSLQTLRYRINWGSLQTAFLTSYEVVAQDGARYEHMRKASIAAVEHAAGCDTVTDRLEKFLRIVVAKNT